MKGYGSFMEKIDEIKDSHPRGGDIRIVTLPENHGPSYARNFIIDNAHGDYLYFMDADDLIREDTIALMMQYVDQEQADIVFGSLEKLAVSGERILYQYSEKHFHKEDELANYAYRKYAGIQASACNILARLSILLSCLIWLHIILMQFYCQILLIHIFAVKIHYLTSKFVIISIWQRSKGILMSLNI